MSIAAKRQTSRQRDDRPSAFLDSYLEFRPIGMTETLVFVVEGRRGIFPLLEFVDYVSFYLHNYTNNFRFVSKLTFLRTYQVQRYNLKGLNANF